MAMVLYLCHIIDFIFYSESGAGSDAESIRKEIEAMDLMENSIPKIFGVKSEKLQHSLLHGRFLTK